MPELNDASSAVAVCGVPSGSQLTHATLCPALTCTVAGTNANFRMKTTGKPAADDGVTQPVVSVEADVERSETQEAEATVPATRASAMPERTRTRVLKWIVISPPPWPSCWGAACSSWYTCPAC